MLTKVDFRGIIKEENARRPSTAPGPCPCSQAGQLRKTPMLSATIHPDIKRTLVSISKRTGMTVSQVTDEVLYPGLIGMQELEGPTWFSGINSLNPVCFRLRLYY
jgi:hypothetical protein